MTYEEWAKEIAAAPMLFDGSSKHVHSRIFADWTNERRTAVAERDKLRERIKVLEDTGRAFLALHIKYCTGSMGDEEDKFSAALEEKP